MGRPAGSRSSRSVAVEGLEGRALFAAGPAVFHTPAAAGIARQLDTIDLGTVTIASADGLTATVHWGDGTHSAGTVDASGTAEAVTGQHAYRRAGRFAVLVDLSDARRSNKVVARIRTTAVVTATGASAVAIRAVAGQPFDGVVTVYRSSSVPLVRSGEALTPSISWGDGTTSTGTLVDRGTAAGGYVTEIHGTHTYADPGRFAVDVTGIVRAAPIHGGPVPLFILVEPLATGTAVVAGA